MHQNVDVLPVEDERVVLDEAFEFDIPCEGPQAYPEVLGHCDRAAKWIGLKLCGHHRLFCGDCKDFYLNLMSAYDGTFRCNACDDYGSRFLGFELINRARH